MNKTYSDEADSDASYTEIIDDVIHHVSRIIPDQLPNSSNEKVLNVTSAIEIDKGEVSSNTRGRQQHASERQSKFIY